MHEVDPEIEHPVRKVELDLSRGPKEQLELGLVRDAEARVGPGEELGEEVRERRLQRRRVREEQAARREEHRVRVPRLRAVVQRVAGVERRAEGGVVGGVESEERVVCRLGDGGEIDEEVLDVADEGGVLEGGRGGEVAYGLGEVRAFVQLGMYIDK